MRQTLSPVDACAIGKRIRELRQARDLKQEELAKLCNLSTSLIGHMERGEKTPSLGTLIVLSRIFGVSIDRIVWGRSDVICDKSRCPLYADLLELVNRYDNK